jgi:hypothetical protein
LRSFDSSGWCIVVVPVTDPFIATVMLVVAGVVVVEEDEEEIHIRFQKEAAVV